MSLRAWVLPLLLLVFLLPQGLRLDLCACAADAHALLCGSAAPAAPAEAPSSCCSAPAPVETPSCEDAGEGEPCPGCPVVELPDFQLDLPVAPPSFSFDLALCETPPVHSESPRGFLPPRTALRGRAPPGKLRLYLLLGRVRC